MGATFTHKQSSKSVESWQKYRIDNPKKEPIQPMSKNTMLLVTSGAQSLIKRDKTKFQIRFFLIWANLE